MTEQLSVAIDDGVALVTLQRPEKRNALSIELRQELAVAFTALADEPTASAVVLTGAGSAFCAGMDLGQFGGDRANREALVASSIDAFESLARCPLPVIAAINGPAVAGGFALALNCDLRVAGPTATLGFPELPRGIPPSYASARAALTAAVAAELCLTGKVLDAEAALQRGVIHRLDSDPLTSALAEARGLSAMPRSALLSTKRRRILERDQRWGFLFEQEEAEFRAAVLGPDDA